jgi:UDP-2,3-diacylglucosamine pyrophosphatase LpxH
LHQAIYWGVNPQHPAPDNWIFEQPDAAIHGQVSKPHHENSKPPVLWTADALENGEEVRYYDIGWISDVHFRDPKIRARLVKETLKHNRFKKLMIIGDLFSNELMPKLPKAIRSAPTHFRERLQSWREVVFAFFQLNDGVEEARKNARLESIRRQVESGDLFGFDVKKDLPPDQQEIIEMFRRLRMEGIEIVFLPGNHDNEWRKRWLNQDIYAYDDRGNAYPIPVRVDDTFELPDGRVAHSLHGHDQDEIASDPNNPKLKAGMYGYDRGSDIDDIIRKERERRGIYSEKYFAAHGKKWAKEFLADFEQRVAAEAAKKGASVVFFGHTHAPGMRYVDVGGKQILVVNTGSAQNMTEFNFAGVRPLEKGGAIEVARIMRPWGSPQTNGNGRRVPFYRELYYLWRSIKVAYGFRNGHGYAVASPALSYSA